MMMENKTLNLWQFVAIVVGVVLLVGIASGSELAKIQTQVDHWQAEIKQLDVYHGIKMQRLTLEPREEMKLDADSLEQNGPAARVAGKLSSEAKLIESIKYALERFAYETSVQLIGNEIAASGMESVLNLSRDKWSQLLNLRLQLRAFVEANRHLELHYAIVGQLAATMATAGATNLAQGQNVNWLASGSTKNANDDHRDTNRESGAQKLLLELLAMRRSWIARAIELRNEIDRAAILVLFASHKPTDQTKWILAKMDELIDGGLECSNCRESLVPGQMYDEAPVVFEGNGEKQLRKQLAKLQLDQLLQSQALLDEQLVRAAKSAPFSQVDQQLNKLLKEAGLF